MKDFKIFFFLALLNIIAFQSFSQQDSIAVDDTVLTSKIFHGSIRTVLLYRNGFDLSPPLILLNSDEKLKLEFDDLEGDYKEFMFTIEHCTKSWKKSGIEQWEYIDGYYDDYITDYEYSMNTSRQYTHYELLFPTENMKPKISGNYILTVYVDEPENVFFRRRFTVVDQKVDITGQVKESSQLEYSNYKQEVDFEIKTTRIKINNPYRELYVVVRQNGRLDNEVKGIQPKMIVGDKINFDYDKEISFDAGNEFRSFDIKSLTYNTEHISTIERNYGEYDVYLKPDESRSYKTYKTEDDIDGYFKIKTEDKQNSAIEAEYVYVHFFLSYKIPLTEGGVYLLGELTNWSYDKNSLMKYDYLRKGYSKTLLLKQGYYNYVYALLSEGETTGDTGFFEGNHSETGNEYTIYVYYSDPALEYDQLIGVAHLNSADDKK